ncbi:hypothetical protein G6F43_000833 [Rhizopus delemar]|nr:hypothetical protein G6F43_000833 [Rhizopus delemar]
MAALIQFATVVGRIEVGCFVVKICQKECVIFREDLSDCGCLQHNLMGCSNRAYVFILNRSQRNRFYLTCFWNSCMDTNACGRLILFQDNIMILQPTNIQSWSSHGCDA